MFFKSELTDSLDSSVLISVFTNVPKQEGRRSKNQPTCHQTNKKEGDTQMERK